MKTIFLSRVAAVLLVLAVPMITPATAAAALTQQESPSQAKVFSGTIIKNGNGYVLSDAANKLSFSLDDSEKASHYEGKKVKVTGTVDVASNTIHVETIQEIA